MLSYVAFSVPDLKTSISERLTHLSPAAVCKATKAVRRIPAKDPRRINVFPKGDLTTPYCKHWRYPSKSKEIKLRSRVILRIFAIRYRSL